MKINTKEIDKIKERIEAIPGWEVEDFKMWEKTNGQMMSTIRLSKSEEESEANVAIGEYGNNIYEIDSGGNGTFVNTRLVRDEDDE